MTAPPDFAEFYAATFGRLAAQLHAFTGDLAEAQDLVQEAFSRAYPRWERIAAYDDPAAWVRRVAWNLAISRWRQVRRVMHWRRDLVADDIPGPDAANVDLIRALRLLPAKQRQVVVMHYMSGLSITEIADFTGAAEGTVKSWLHRARTALAVHLETSEEVSRG
ncbi:RNA polymerase sigma24 factor [Catellatospora sp. IY07-71]|uniref:SigE family RNA polymerase sigma factor n=1 Tax=Catellatospora sp. IY07-71 TaxID=2728827 RepID=UPI001BB5CFB8|nr:SigE family RNA polymerase sigma factor [Catellatospora sp. IY07-71]BCJ71438.1 RNA polymerase sigma24 factor [Catellatospora sp. IY07-71]